MPIDPATVPPLTEQDIVRVLRETGYVIASERDADIVKNKPYGAAAARAAYALAASRVDTAEVERRAKYEALTDAINNAGPWNHGVSQAEWTNALRYLREYRDRRYAPAPRECVLSDGSVVTRVSEKGGASWRRSYANVPERLPRRVEATEFPSILNDYDTGADFDKLKAFAAEVGQ